MSTFRKVRAGTRYRYEPVGIDRCSPANSGLQVGEIVTVTNLPGCPKANVAGHCHVLRADGSAGGLVVTNSLRPLSATEPQKRS